MIDYFHYNSLDYYEIKIMKIILLINEIISKDDNNL